MSTQPTLDLALTDRLAARGATGATIAEVAAWTDRDIHGAAAACVGLVRAHGAVMSWLIHPDWHSTDPDSRVVLSGWSGLPVGRRWRPTRAEVESTDPDRLLAAFLAASGGGGQSTSELPWWTTHLPLEASPYRRDNFQAGVERLAAEGWVVRTYVGIDVRPGAGGDLWAQAAAAPGAPMRSREDGPHPDRRDDVRPTALPAHGYRYDDRLMDVLVEVHRHHAGEIGGIGNWLGRAGPDMVRPEQPVRAYTTARCIDDEPDTGEVKRQRLLDWADTYLPDHLAARVIEAAPPGSVELVFLDNDRPEDR